MFTTGFMVSILGCSQIPQKEKCVHTFNDKWSSNETCHWHAATCEHSENVSDKSAHVWDEGVITRNSTEYVEGEKTFICIVCSKTKSKSIEKLSHTHKFSTKWSGDENFHWHGASCEHEDQIADKATHDLDDGIVTIKPTVSAEGVKTYTCKVCQKTFMECIERLPFSDWCEIPIDDMTGEAATTNSKYVCFGVFPKTVLPLDSTVTINEKDSVTMGANIYYKGSDGNYYVKTLENSYSTDYKYTDQTLANKIDANSYRYFKVEPIKWKVLTTDYKGSGNSLLLAEDILIAGVSYYEDDENRGYIYQNNYRYSQIRAYLNGYSYGARYENSIWNEIGFLQTAFTTSAQDLIATTTVVNNEESTTDVEKNIKPATGFTCNDGYDKIFLLSENESTNPEYGFGAYDSSFQRSGRIRVTTDYAKANFAYQQRMYNLDLGLWWLRSPGLDSRVSRIVGEHGQADCQEYVLSTLVGVVPALTISLQ